ncbi:MAG TPA: hypothetical protein VII56_08830 [Rhizomicrobium sp.]
MPDKKPREAGRVVAKELPDATLPDPGPSVRDHPNSRAIAHFVADFILRSAEGISEIFDHDYEAAVIFLTISNRNSEKAMSDPKLRELYGSYQSTIPPEHALLISRMALSRATGLPRETVRRKVAKLIAKGWVIELEGGLRARPDLNRDARYIAVLQPQAQNLRRLFAALLSTGALNTA